MRASLLAGLVAALAVPAAAVSAAGAPPTDNGPQVGSHDLSSPLADKQRALTQKAMELKVKGKFPAGSKVGQVAKGQYVELAREDTDRVFVVIAEFGDSRHPSYPDGASDATTFEGPMHNEIPEPDRSVDNTTLWQPDYDRGHYENMYFDRMAGYYEAQSSGQLLGRRRCDRVGEGAVQRGPLRP